MNPDKQLDAELLRAIKPLAIKASDARLDALEREIERLFPNGGFRLGYQGARSWFVEGHSKRLGAMGLAHALKAAKEVAKKEDTDAEDSH